MEEKEKVVYTACQGWRCHEHCVLTTHVADGRIQRTERTIALGPDAEFGAICQKGIVAGKYPYISERLQYPLKRVGERGEGKFERISWDQALTEIGSKLKAISAKYGPRSIIVNTFPCGLPLTMCSLSHALAMRFIFTSDCGRMTLPGVDQSTIWSQAIDFGDSLLSVLQATSDLSDSKHIIIWGGNPIGFTRASHTSRTLIDAQENGAKLVDIGIIYDSTAAKADQFVAIRPGTDAALALSMANQIIQDGLWDNETMSRYTVAPLLVRDDNGKYLREIDVKNGGSESAYMYWNSITDSATPINSKVYDFAEGAPALETIATINGIACKTAFVRLKEHLTPWTPEKQEKITGVPAETVRQLVREYLAVQPSSIFLNMGMRYANAVHSARAIDLLPALSGNLIYKSGYMGGPINDGPLVSLNEPAMWSPEGFANLKGYSPQFTEILDSFNNPDGQQYRAYINTFSNPLQCWPNPEIVGKQFFGNLELAVVIDYRETDTLPWADYVLPECMQFEREEIIVPSSGCIILQEPAIDPQGEAKPPAFIWGGIAKNYGLGEFFGDWDTEDWNRYRVDSSEDPAFKGSENPITYDRLKKEKIIPLNLSDEKFEPCYNSSPTGRYEFYCEGLTGVGAEMAIYEPPRILGPEREKYPLQFYPGRHRVFMQSQFQEIPELRVIDGHKTQVALNPIGAKERGISEGDLVEIFNDRGSVQCSATLSEAIPPDMAHLWYAYPAKDYATDPPTVLSTAISSHDATNEFTLEWEGVWRKQNLDAGIPQVMIFQNGSNNSIETYWDDLCDVRKIEEAVR